MMHLSKTYENENKADVAGSFLKEKIRTQILTNFCDYTRFLFLFFLAAHP